MAEILWVREWEEETAPALGARVGSLTPSPGDGRVHVGLSPHRLCWLHADRDATLTPFASYAAGDYELFFILHEPGPRAAAQGSLPEVGAGLLVAVWGRHAHLPLHCASVT